MAKDKPDKHPDAFVPSDGDVKERLAALEAWAAKCSRPELLARAQERQAIESAEMWRVRDAEQKAVKARRQELHAMLSKKGLDSVTSLAPSLGGTAKIANAIGVTLEMAESLIFVRKQIKATKIMGNEHAYVTSDAVVEYLIKKEGK